MPDADRGRRAQILAAAVDVLLEKGLHAATTRAVTSRAQVGTGLLNHYFRWPELRALAWETIFDAVAQAQSAGRADPARALATYFDGAFDAEARRYWLLWIEAAELAAADPLLAGALRRVNARLQDGLAGILRAGVEAGIWSLPDPDATALRLSALHDGLTGMIVSGVASFDQHTATAHLRTAFRCECGG
jgi:AcrR family transcriptional regulator